MASGSDKNIGSFDNRDSPSEENHRPEVSVGGGGRGGGYRYSQNHPHMLQRGAGDTPLDRAVASAQASLTGPSGESVSATLANGRGDAQQQYRAEVEFGTDRPTSTASSLSASSGRRGGGTGTGTTGRGRPPGTTGAARKEQLRAARTERKRCREKKRRSDVNKGFDELTTLIMRIDPGGGDGDGGETGAGGVSSSLAADGVADKDQPPANRVALIARTVRVLERLHEENEDLRRRLRRRVGEVDSSLPSPTSSSAKAVPGGHTMADSIAEKRGIPRPGEAGPQHGNAQDRRGPGAAGTGADDATLLVPVMIPWDGTSSRPPPVGPLNHDHSVPLSQLPPGSVFPLSTPLGSGTRDALLRYSSAAATLEELHAARRTAAEIDLRLRHQQSAADLDRELRHRQQMAAALRYQQSTARLGIGGGEAGLASEAAVAAAARESVAAETVRLRQLEMEVLSRAAAERQQQQQRLGQSSRYGDGEADAGHSRGTASKAEAEAPDSGRSSAADLHPRNADR